MFELHHHTLAQTFERVGQALFPDEWIGAEISTTYVLFAEADAMSLAARRETLSVMPAGYWAVDALKPVWRDNQVTLQDTTLPSDKRSGTHAGGWPAKGIVGFRRDDVEACLAEVSAQG